MKNQKECVIITAADKNYIKQAKQLFSSVYHNSGWPGDYMLLAYDIPEKDLKWFRDKGIIVRKDKTKIKARNGKLPPVIFSRYLIFKSHFKQWKKVIFLDSDIIVRTPLSDLTKIKGFAAVKDPLSLKDQIKENYVKEIEKKYNLKKSSFNAGVMAINTRILSKNTFNEILKLHNKYSKLSKFDDQTILNLYFYNRWISLPLLYNINPHIYIYNIRKNLQSKYFENAVLHFYGPKKPWLSSSPYRKEWLDNLGKAEKIDLKDRKIASKKANALHISKTILALKTKRLYLEKIDKNIGKAGLIIKKHAPKAYHFLKALKSNKSN